MNDPRGSVWRVWDLHFHTPSSFDYQDKSVSNEEIVSGLQQASVHAVAITDHNKIDVGRINALRALAGVAITFFPGIELRTDLGGSSKVHVIGIFSEVCDLPDISMKLAAKLNLSPSDLASKGEENVYVSFPNACKEIKALGGLVSVHAGTKSNSIEGLANAQKINQVIKTDYAKEYIDIYEIGTPTDAAAYKQIVFPCINKELPLVICSDNHDIKYYSTKAPCWIKANTTFAGLQQVIQEPESRVYIGDMPDKLSLVAANKSRFLRQIEVRKLEGSALSETWFDTNIELNHDLVVIIGNKGGGKSALADVMGHLGDTLNHKYFSFLAKDRFRIPKPRLSQEFQGKLTWESGVVSKKLLGDPPSSSELEAVKLIPQSYLESVCNTVGTAEKSDFDLELEDVIFSHVGPVERLGCSRLRDLLEHKTAETQQEIRILADDLYQLNRKIVRLERKNQPEYRSRTEKLLKLRSDELANFDKTRPPEVKQPTPDSVVSDEFSQILNSLASKQAQSATLMESISATHATVEQCARRRSAAQKIKEKLDNLNMHYERFKADCDFELSHLSPLTIDDLITFRIDYTELHRKLSEVEARESEAKVALSDTDPQKSLVMQKASLDTEIALAREKLDEPNRAYQTYLQQSEYWEQQRALIVGDSDTADSLEFFKNELLELSTIQDDINRLYIARINCVQKIFRAKKKLAESYREVHRPVQHFIETHEAAQKELGLDFEVSMTDTGFEREFIKLVDLRKSGTFGGGDEGRGRLARMLSEVDFNDEDETTSFVTAVLTALRFDQKLPVQKSIDPESQLKSGVKLEDVYNNICSLDYIEPRYVLKLRGKSLNQLSPGEKGTLLVIFYLLIDKRDIPLIIDQPEGNLDSETVFRSLVPCVREAKKRRQVILVTHNPNLAVVCDAEQVIYAQMDKSDGNRITYFSGAIENPSINRKLSDVLEGTLNAFTRRGSKYHIS